MAAHDLRPSSGSSVEAGCRGQRLPGGQQRLSRGVRHALAVLFRERRAPRPRSASSLAVAGATGAPRGIRVSSPLECGAGGPPRGVGLLDVALMVTGARGRSAGPCSRTSPSPRLGALLPLALTLAALGRACAAGAGSRLWRRVRSRRPCSRAGVRTARSADARARYRIVNPASPPLSMDGEGAGPQQSVLPLVRRTPTSAAIIPANFFMTSETCGRCHKDIYDQWNSSAHHFSSFNNQWYRKSIEYMQDVVGTQAVEVVRRLPRPRGVLQRPLRPADQGADRHAGGAGRAGLHVVPLDHARRQHDGPGRLRDRVPAAARPRGERESGPAVRARPADCMLDPEPHRETFLKPFHREQTPEFCSSCHKVHLDVPVNAYRWFRGFNDYDNWQASGVSGEGARSFYYPPKPQKCADCHMPLVQVERSGGEERQGPLAPLPGGEHRAAVRERRRGAAEGGAGFPAGRRRSRWTSSALVRGGERRRAGADGRASAPSQRLAEHLRGRRGVDELRRAAGVHRHAGGGHRRRSTRSTPSVRARRIGPRRGRGPHAQGRPLLSRRHGRRVRRLGRARGGRRQGPRDLPQRRGRGRRQGPGRARRALLSQPAARRARQPDQQAQRLGGALGRLRPPDPARRRRHRPLPPADPRGCAATDHAAGEGELPQVRVVEHAVGLSPASAIRNVTAASVDAGHDDGRWSSPATRRRSRARSRRSPTFRSR